MSDDRFKDAGEFEPKRAWGKIRKGDFLRRSEARNPMRFRDYLIVIGGAIALIAIPLILISFFF